MARTYKRYPASSYYRCPRGRRQAIRAGARKGAIPPDAWDDRPFDSQCWLPMKVARNLAKKGFSFWEIVRHTQRKFKLLLDDAIWMAEYADYERPYTPDGCLRVYEEDNMSLKKARKIVVDGETYSWKVSPKGGLHLAFERDSTGRRTIVWLEEGTVVTPGFVRRKIDEQEVTV